MPLALAASIGVAERWMTKRNMHCSSSTATGGLKTLNGRSWVKPRIREHHTLLIAKVTVADRIIKATCCDWLLATTNVDFARTLHNFHLTDSIFESVRRLLSWSGQQHTNVLASLRPAYITQLVGVSRQIIRHLGVSRLMYARHKLTVSYTINQSITFEASDISRSLPLALVRVLASELSLAPIREIARYQKLS